MSALPLLDHPIVLAAAEEMARERWEILSSIVAAEEPHEPTGWDFVPEYGKRRHIAVNARLLCNLTRPASRDWWVRWNIDRDGTAGERVRRMSDSVSLRDNPEALATAILAALV